MKLLQSWGADDYPDSIEGFFEELLSGYTDLMPIEVLGTFIFGAFALASFIRSDSPIIPLGFVMLTGASVIPLIAPIGVQAAILLVLLAGAGIMTLAWYVYSS